MDHGDARGARDERALSRRRRASPPIREWPRPEGHPRDEVLAELERDRIEVELEAWRRQRDLELLDLKDAVRHRHEMRAQKEFGGIIRLIRSLALTSLLIAALLLLLINGRAWQETVGLLARLI